MEKVSRPEYLVHLSTQVRTMANDSIEAKVVVFGSQDCDKSIPGVQFACTQEQLQVCVLVCVLDCQSTYSVSYILGPCIKTERCN